MLGALATVYDAYTVYLVYTLCQVDTVLEFFCLGFIAVYIVLKFIWFGPKQFITSKTTVINVSNLDMSLHGCHHIVNSITYTYRQLSWW